MYHITTGEFTSQPPFAAQMNSTAGGLPGNWVESVEALE